jgi:hypothetical protein
LRASRDRADQASRTAMRTADDVRHAEWLRIIEQLNTDRAWDDPLFDWLVPQLCARATSNNYSLHHVGTFMAT